jgi:hypothetical protein
LFIGKIKIEKRRKYTKILTLKIKVSSKKIFSDLLAPTLEHRADFSVS